MMSILLIVIFLLKILFFTIVNYLSMSSILSILHPLVSEDFIILGKSENYAILYRNVKGNLQTFKTDFKRIIMVIEKKVGNYKMQLIQDNHVLVVLKLKLQKRNEDLTVRVDLFDLPVKNLRGEIFIVQDPYILESILSKMDGAKKAISNKDNEKNKRKQLEKNKEVFEAYRTHNKSFKKLVELGIIKLKEVLHYENCIERLEREDEKLNKKIKLEE